MKTLIKVIASLFIATTSILGCIVLLAGREVHVKRNNPYVRKDRWYEN